MLRIHKKLIKGLFYIFIIALVFYLLSRAELKLVLASIIAISPSIFIFCLFLQVLTQLSLTYQWSRLAKQLALPSDFKGIFMSNFYEGFYDAITPGAKIGGEAVRVLFLKKEMNYSTEDALSLLFVQKSFSITSFLMLVILSIFILSRRIQLFSSPVLQLFIIVLSLLLTFFLLAFLFQTKTIYEKLSKRRAQGKMRRKVLEVMASFSNHSELLGGNRKEIIIQFLLSFFIWLLYPFKLFILLTGFKTMSMGILIPLVFFSYFLATIPILPGGLGTFEGSLSGLLTLFGMPLSTGLGVTLVFRFITYWFVMLFSGAAILLWKIKKKSFF